MISKQNCVKVSILISKALVWKKKCWWAATHHKNMAYYSLSQDFFFQFNMQKYIQDLHNILHTLNHTMHSIFPCKHILRQHELSFSFLLFFIKIFEMSLMENKCLKCQFPSLESLFQEEQAASYWRKMGTQYMYW